MHKRKSANSFAFFCLLVCCLITPLSFAQIDQSSRSTNEAASFDTRAEALFETMSRAISRVDPSTPTYIPGDKNTLREVLLQLQANIKNNPDNSGVVDSAIARLRNAYIPNTDAALRNTSIGDKDRYTKAVDAASVMTFTGAVLEYQELAVQRQALKAREPGDAAAVEHLDIAELIDLAKRGNAPAQGQLGVRYVRGDGVPQDYELAATWLERAAVQGLPSAQSDLGALYHAGQGVPQDFGRASVYYGLAAEQGNGFAALNLGGLFFMGQGVQKDLSQAAYWFTLAANSDDSRASGPGQLWSDRVQEIARRIEQQQQPLDSESELGKGVTVGLVFLAVAYVLTGGGTSSNSGDFASGNSGQTFTPQNMCSGWSGALDVCN
jgi:hypothetical protein